VVKGKEISRSAAKAALTVVGVVAMEAMKAMMKVIASEVEKVAVKSRVVGGSKDDCLGVVDSKGSHGDGGKL
jgi:hypothetical protein